MKRPDRIYALSATGKMQLRQLMHLGPLLAFDFDGTLAPIVADPVAAVLSDKTAKLLRKLAQERPCVVISGRARADVLDRFRDIPIVEAIGNHGSEPWLNLAPLRAEVAGWIPIVKQELAQVPGILIEEKGCSLSIHYRHALHPRKTLAALHRLTQQLRIPRVVRGKYVLNLLPAGALNKGSGLLRTLDALNRTCALYIGDDVTDEDVYALPEAGPGNKPARILGIRVEPPRRTQAPLYLRQQAEVDALLEFLTNCAFSQTAS